MATGIRTEETPRTHADAVRILQGQGGSDVIEVAGNFTARQGAELLPGVLVGKLLGEGMAGAVYLLDDNSGASLGWVLKAKLAGTAGRLSCLFPSWEREWTIGRQLTTELDRDKTTGFMHTGAMVVREGSKQLVGICLQQMHGSTLDSVLLKAATERAMNAALIQQALREVFCAVADAQEKLGFRHWDLRLANVMQHTPLQRVGNISEAAVEAGSAKPDPAAQPELQYKVIDFGHGNLYDRQLKRRDRKASWHRKAKLGGIPVTEACYRLFWWHEGDVFRLLMSLQNVLDGCIWHSSDAELTADLQDFLRHVTGVRINMRVVGAKSASMSFPAPSRKPGRSSAARRLLIRTRAFWFPRHPSITAEQALLHPFFQAAAAV